MVQFLSIHFFSWISSIFVGFFKISHFFCVTLYKVNCFAVKFLAVLHRPYNNGPATKFSSLPQVAPHSGHLEGGDTTTWRKWCDVHEGKIRHESVTPTARYITSLQQYPWWLNEKETAKITTKFISVLFLNGTKRFIFLKSSSCVVLKIGNQFFFSK